MVRPAEDWLKSLGLLTKREFATPWGICDLVGLAFNKRHVKKRLALGQRRPIGPPRRVAVLMRIPDIETGASVRLATLQRQFGPFIPPEAVARDVEILVSRKFVCRTQRGTFQSVNGWLPLHKRLVAVELKLSRVEEALGQAFAHRDMTHESYVALPESRARRIRSSDRANAFRNAGIGLLGVAPNVCRVLLAPRPKAPTGTVAETHCVERFWQPLIRDS
jgi:hypothetical protein